MGNSTRRTLPNRKQETPRVYWGVWDEDREDFMETELASEEIAREKAIEQARNNEGARIHVVTTVAVVSTSGPMPVKWEEEEPVL